MLSLELVRRALATAENLSLQELARALGMTPRTLQRRLKAEGTSYRVIVDQIQLEFAARALSDSTSACNAGNALGFSEPAAFWRAFKRWTGTTPGRFMVSES